MTIHRDLMETRLHRSRKCRARRHLVRDGACYLSEAMNLADRHSTLGPCEAAMRPQISCINGNVEGREFRLWESSPLHRFAAYTHNRPEPRGRERHLSTSSRRSQLHGLNVARRFSILRSASVKPAMSIFAVPANREAVSFK